MSELSLNEAMLASNGCFGCGPANPHGLGVKFYRDPESPERLRGKFVVPHHTTGLPGIAHGGVLYSALDCLAAWVKFVLRPDRRLFPIGRTSTITYHRPARAGEPLTLIGTVAKDPASPKEPMIVHCAMLNATGELVAEGDFTLVLLPVQTFKRVSGITEIPEEYRPYFDEA